MVKIVNVNTSLVVKFNKDFKKNINSEFVEGTALIAYKDENRNYSSIPEQAFEDAMPTLPLIPIVGNWIESKKNFGGHDMVIEKKGTELIFKDNTIPYGVVKENHNAQWVEITEEDGTVKKYLQADVVLWAGRYQEPVEKIINDGVNQSMELNIVDYTMREDNYLQIDKFEYSALCILGKDVNEDGSKGKDNVEPCFESASIVVKSEEFSRNFEALKFALSDKQVETETEDGVKPQEDEFDNQDDKNDVEPTKDSVLENKFMLNSEKREKLREAIPRQESAEDTEYWYWVMDFDDEFVYFEEELHASDKYEYSHYRCKYSVLEDDEITVDANSKEEVERIWVTKAEADKIESERETSIMALHSKVDELTKDLESYKLNVSEKEKSIKELQAYKNNVETQIKEAKVNELIEEFTETLKDNEEFVHLSEKAMDMEVEELEKELYVLVGKIKYQRKEKKQKKNNFSAVVIEETFDDSKEDKKIEKIREIYGEASKYFCK